MISLSLVLLYDLYFYSHNWCSQVLQGDEADRGRKENLLLVSLTYLWSPLYLLYRQLLLRILCLPGWVERIFNSATRGLQFINYHWKLYRCLFSLQVPSPGSRPWSEMLHILLHSLTGSGCNSLSASMKRERFISSCREKIRFYVQNL